MTTTESWRDRLNEIIRKNEVAVNAPQYLVDFIAQELKAAVGMVRLEEIKHNGTFATDIEANFRQGAITDLESAKAKVLKELGV